MFVDKAHVLIRAGDGGKGAISFHREKYVSAGGPDGGDGGKGGDVIFRVDDNVNTLEDFRFQRNYIAEQGEDGGRRQCSGKGGKDLIVKVPRGTLVRDQETGRLIADLSNDGDTILAAGGKGGAGNQHFATATRQIPRFAKPGKKGDEFKVTLELKLLADVGLVGFPNVGKSTLISVVSAAKPTIANYHFTTLTPVLGVVRIDDGNSFVMADIPGLIEGASDGVGLGHDFLRHVERCRLVLHIVDISGCEGRDPIEDFAIINRELASFSEELASRPQLVAGNKSDMATAEQIASFKSHVEKMGYEFFEISGATTKGVKELISAVSSKLATLPPVIRYEAQPITKEELLAKEAKRQEFHVTHEDGVYYVEADFLDGIVSVAELDDYEALQYFQRVLRQSGIIDKLESMGIQEGDTVDIFGFAFEFMR